jgi:hypothetical protein
MKTTLFVSLLFFTLAHAGEIAAPGEAEMQKFIQGKLPTSYLFKSFDSTGERATGTDLIISGNLTVAATESVYLNVTTDMIPELEDHPDLPANLEPPTVLERTRVTGAVVEMPVEIACRRAGDRWEPVAFESSQPFNPAERPLTKFPSGALIAGSSQTQRIVAEFRQQLQKLPSGSKPAASPSKTCTRTAVTPEAETGVPPEDKMATLLALCRPGRAYNMTVPDAKGIYQAFIRFDKVEDDGGFISAEIVDRRNVFKRRSFTGMIRGNPKIDSRYELYLVGADTEGAKTPGTNSPVTIVTKTSLTLTLDSEGCLVGDITSVTGTNRKLPNTRLSQKKIDAQEYPLRIRVNSSPSTETVAAGF